ncbi:hypothetical protein LWI28_024753 [Acer negundo]|uniref:CCHC-type domain-containing protein n=1 Tax=Acer negundo TaxID=4023 RepID=A0AAD5JG83_ACENE|nr:hypothetical protein LWI28_024753 [Acer negundo]
MERGPSGSYNHGRSKSRSRKNVKCYICGKKGHVKSECWHNKKKSGDNRAPESSSSQGCVASTSDDGEVLHSEGNTAAEGRKRFANVWLLDSAATWHMTSQREWFHKYEPVSRGSVFMGNDHALKIDGIGTIKIKMHDGTIRTIYEVRHVKGLKKNLLSLGQLDDLGCLSNSFRAKVAKTAYYVINRSPSIAIELKTPMEMWIGYADGVKMYRLRDPTTHKVVISRYVIFLEDQLQKEEDNITSKENTETTDVQVENNQEQEDSVSSEAEPEHETQVLDESEAPEVRRLTRERRPPVWHSEMYEI